MPTLDHRTISSFTIIVATCLCLTSSFFLAVLSLTLLSKLLRLYRHTCSQSIPSSQRLRESSIATRSSSSSWAEASEASTARRICSPSAAASKVSPTAAAAGGGGLVVSLSPGLNMDSSLSEAFDNIIELKPTCSSRLVIGTTFGAILVLPILPILKILGAIDKMISIRAHNLVDGVATVLEGVEVHETGHKIFESDLIPRLV
mmetsp:Transcript_17321/g.49595  ORF Transcript_17321/g.49595 Transcript_17321/m.49595 type:complete len:203 (-) Transcript_17321:343-951(-)